MTRRRQEKAGVLKSRARGFVLDTEAIKRILDRRPDFDFISSERDLYLVLTDLVKPRRRTIPGKPSYHGGKRVAFLERGLLQHLEIDESSVQRIAKAIGIGKSNWQSIVHPAMRRADYSVVSNKVVRHTERLISYERLLEETIAWSSDRRGNNPERQHRLISAACRLFDHYHDRTNRDHLRRKEAVVASTLAFIIQRVTPDVFPEGVKYTAAINKVWEGIRSKNRELKSLGGAIGWNLAKIYHKLSVKREKFGKAGYLRDAANAYQLTGSSYELQMLPAPVLLTGINIDLPEHVSFEAASPAVRSFAPPWRYQFASAISASHSCWNSRSLEGSYTWNHTARQVLARIADRISAYSQESALTLRSSKVVLCCNEVLLNQYDKPLERNHAINTHLEAADRLIDELCGGACFNVSHARSLETVAVLYAAKKFLLGQQNASPSQVDASLYKSIEFIQRLRDEAGSDLYFMRIDPIYEMAIGKEDMEHFLTSIA